MEQPPLDFEDLPRLLDWAALSTMSMHGALPLAADGKHYGDATDFPLVPDHVDELVTSGLASCDDLGGIKVVMITAMGETRCAELKAHLDARYRPEGVES